VDTSGGHFWGPKKTDVLSVPVEVNATTEALAVLDGTGRSGSEFGGQR
jgi:hypothetical protein